MEFTVREGFIVHDTKIVTVKQNGTEVKQPQVSTFYEGQDVDFDEDSALAHLHKLQPADKSAEAFAAASVLKGTTTAAPIDHSTAISALAEQLSTLTQLITQLVVAAPAESAVPAGTKTAV